jgi:protein-disulfide isomerase
MLASTRLKAILDTASSLALIFAAGFFVWKAGFAPAPPAPAPREPVQAVDGVRLDASRLSNITGAGDVIVVEFTDFQCPFCRTHARETFPTLRKELIDTGKARYASINYPIERIHPDALPAAKVAECAGEQGKFWEMHARLFMDDTATAVERFDEHVRILKLDTSRFKQCFTGDQVAAKVKRDQAEARRVGINSTPIFLVGRMDGDGGVAVMLRINGAQEPEVFMRAVEDVRSGKAKKS